MFFALTGHRSTLLYIFAACVFTIPASYPTWVAAETTAEAVEQAKRATVGILEDTQDPRTPDKPGKIKIRGTGFHLHDGYILTARHALQKNTPPRPNVPTV